MAFKHVSILSILSSFLGGLPPKQVVVHQYQAVSVVLP